MTFTPPGTAATDVEIRGFEMAGGTGIQVEGYDGTVSIDNETYLAEAIYTMDSDTAHVTTNPINGQPVQYFKIVTRRPAIELNIGNPEEA